MNVRDVHLDRFRNHHETRIEFGGSVNVLHGRNGQGKTNILEALSCLCLTKSYFTANDATLVQFGQEGFSVEGLLVNDAGMEQKVRVAYAGQTGEKVFSVNGARLEKLSFAIGMFPVVILAPESSAITMGGPSDRRKFIDLVLSQLSRSYFDDLLEYRRVLRQRNSILGEARQGKNVREEVLEPWDKSLASRGARVVCRRVSFLQEFSGYVTQSYHELAGTTEEPSLYYVTAPVIAGNETADQIAENILVELEAKRSEELRRGLSLVGPHRDDIALELNGLDLRKYASQGQHKTFLVALKMAEFTYLKERREETPVLLLDDVLSELDEQRSQRLLHRVTRLGQAMVTATDAVPFKNALPWGMQHRRFVVEEGTCKPVRIDDIEKAAIGA